MPISNASFGQWLKYQRLLLRRAGAEHRVYSRSVAALSTGLGVTLLGTTITYFIAKHLDVPGTSLPLLEACLVGVLASFGLWWILSLVWFRLREPFSLDEERKEELAAARLEAQATIAALTKTHAEELESLRREQTAEKESLREQLAAALSPVTAALLVTAHTHHLSHLYRTANAALTAGFANHEFAVLNVTNVSQRNLTQIVARCRFGDGEEDFSIWSAKTGAFPFDPGTHEADLSAGNSRLLVVAQGFGDEELWARLPPEGELLYVTYLVRTMSEAGDSKEGETAFFSAGTDRTLPKELPITVSFRAEGFYQEERFTLGFKDGRPTITATGEQRP